MKKYIWLMACLVAFSPLSANAAKKQKKAKKAQTELWPDGTKMDAWFSNAQKVNVDTLGKKYVLTDYGRLSSTVLPRMAVALSWYLPEPIRAVPSSSSQRLISMFQKAEN